MAEEPERRFNEVDLLTLEEGLELVWRRRDGAIEYLGRTDHQDPLPAPEQPSAEASYVAPRTPVEEVLAGIWAKVLGLEQVGANGHFFDLGGHSLLAVQVMARIEHVLGVKVPILELFEAPTVERLAGVIQSGSGAALRAGAPASGRRGRPLFLVHPVGGNVFSYVELAKKLGATRPVYGLAGGRGRQRPSSPRWRTWQREYLATVREVQAEGPWLLAGWSSGAVTAYEMARQIEIAGGDHVALDDVRPRRLLWRGAAQAVDDTAAPGRLSQASASFRGAGGVDSRDAGRAGRGGRARPPARAGAGRWMCCRRDWEGPGCGSVSICSAAP